MQTFCLTLLLFAFEANRDFRFCVDYKKLNAITKRNRYFLPFIDKVIRKILVYKYLIRLDVISVLIKLWMHSKNMNGTIFITFWSFFKYQVLPFGLTNSLNLFQQNISDISLEYLNAFSEAYLDYIFIYSKIKKDYWEHVKLILEKLEDTDRLINIKKCKFNVEKLLSWCFSIWSGHIYIDFRMIETIVNLNHS